MKPAAAKQADEVAALPDPIPGIDQVLGLAHALGRQALYLSQLRKFVSGQADAAQEVAAALERGDAPCAQRLAHTLKGTAAAIGARALAQSAARLEAAIGTDSERATLDALVREVGQPLAQIVDALRAALPQQAERAAPEQIDAARFKAVVARLTARLADNDAEANDIFAENAELLRGALGERYAQLEQALGDYDFDLALSTLEASLAASGRPL